MEFRSVPDILTEEFRTVPDILTEEFRTVPDILNEEFRSIPDILTEKFRSVPDIQTEALRSVEITALLDSKSKVLLSVPCLATVLSLQCLHTLQLTCTSPRDH